MKRETIDITQHAQQKKSDDEWFAFRRKYFHIKFDRF